MKKENKNIMKVVKLLTIILAIILISMIGFFGIYAQSKNQMVNKVKDYTYSKEINGARTIKLELNGETTEVVKDSEGNIIEDATDEQIEQNGYVKEQVPNNSDEVKTQENYKKAKEIIEKRLSSYDAQDYTISLNETTGEMTIEIPENDSTDTIVGNIAKIGKFEIIDSETKDVLMDNSDIKSSDILYNTTTSGTTVYLEIAFNRDGKNKLEEISKTYVKTEEENEQNVAAETTTAESVENNTTDETTDETTTEKKITMKIDDEEIMSTSFDEPLTTGKIQLSVGSATTDSTTLQDYIAQARTISIALDSGKLPIKYDVVKNQYILSNISEQNLICIAIVIAVVVAIGIIVLIVKYKLNGLLAGISFVGLTALFIILVRYANVIISIESIFGIISILILNYIFTLILLNNIKKIGKEKEENIVNKATKETYIKFFNRIVPICIMVIAFCFVKWIPISSFGMISFWGLVLIATYNAVITRILLKIKVESK